MAFAEPSSRPGSRRPMSISSSSPAPTVVPCGAFGGSRCGRGGRRLNRRSAMAVPPSRAAAGGRARPGRPGQTSPWSCWLTGRRRHPARDRCHRRLSASPTVADQVAAGDDSLRYATFLSWRGFLAREPPRRPDPVGPAAPPSLRTGHYKYGFVGPSLHRVRHPAPAAVRVCVNCKAIDHMVAGPMADALGTVATYTVDHLAFSPSPPVIAAVVDFDGGGRFSCELTDADPAGVAIGDRVEMTFRRIVTAGGIHNYFWKPARQGSVELRGRRSEASAVAIVGMGCTNFGEHWDGRSTTCSSSPPRGLWRSAGVTRDDIDAYWLGTLGRGSPGSPSRGRCDWEQAGDAGREHVCHRLGGPPQRVLCGGVGSLRRRHGDRRGEAEGLRVLGSGRPPRCPTTAPCPRRPPRPASACSPRLCGKVRRR